MTAPIERTETEKLAEYIKDGRLTLYIKNYDRRFASDPYFEDPYDLSDEQRNQIADALTPLPVPERAAEGAIMDRASPEPCADLTINDLCEWLANPQYVNGILNFEAVRHMMAAAKVIDRLAAAARTLPSAEEIIRQCAKVAADAAEKLDKQARDLFKKRGEWEVRAARDTAYDIEQDILALSPAPTGADAIDVTGLSHAEIEDVRAHVRGKIEVKPTYDYALGSGWRCFHCGEMFRTPGGAQLHFGEKPTDRPACVAGTDAGTREALVPFAAIGGLLVMAGDAIPDGVSANRLKLHGLTALEFKQAHRALAACPVLTVEGK